MAKRFLFVLIAIGMVLLMAGCDVNPSKVSQKYANEMGQKLTYTHDARTGLCYAMIATRKTGNGSQSGMGMTQVPCSKKVIALIK